MPVPCWVFLRFYLFIFRERGREGEREGEQHQCCWLPLMCSSTWDLARNPGMCPDWESNQKPFGSQASTQSTELHQQGPHPQIFNEWVSVKQPPTEPASHWDLGSRELWNDRDRLDNPSHLNHFTKGTLANSPNPNPSAASTFYTFSVSIVKTFQQ